MVNEFFFFIQVFLVIGFSIGAVRLGAQALISLIALEGVLANLFVVKQMTLFGLTVTCSDVFAIGCILGLNLLQEHFGKESAKQAVKISFAALVFFVFVSQVHLWYIPSSVDRTHQAFDVVLFASPRIVFASLGVYWFVQKLDILLFGCLKSWFRGGWFSLRVGISLVLTQWIDTVLFSFLGLYGLVASLFDVIIVSFTVKCLVILTSAPLVALSKQMIKRGEPS